MSGGIDDALPMRDVYHLIAVSMVREKPGACLQASVPCLGAFGDYPFDE